MKKTVFYIFTLFLTVMLMAGCSKKITTAKKEKIDLQSNTVISYLGPEGTYTHEACIEFFENAGTYVPYVTVQEAVDALTSKKSSYAVIPQENTIGGPVIDYIDCLLGETSVFVTGEVELTINQNLLVKPGTKLEDIKVVYSHPQGIIQSEEWRKSNLPDAEIVKVSSTAEGARLVLEADDNSCAAIASKASSEIYNLDILAYGVQQNENNKTRFYVLSLDEPSAYGERLAFVAKGKAADLPELMSELNRQGVELIAIHDRPAKSILGEYLYLIECAECNYEDYKKIVKKINSFEYRYLGSF